MKSCIYNLGVAPCSHVIIVVIVLELVTLESVQVISIWHYLVSCRQTPVDMGD